MEAGSTVLWINSQHLTEPEQEKGEGRGRREGDEKRERV